MVSSTKTQTTYILELTDNEAKLLSAIVQNPLRNDESAVEREFRQELWDALNPPIDGGSK